MSDHCPLFLCPQQRPRSKARFKFEQFWMKVPGFLEVVKGAWEKEVPGQSALNILHHKLLSTATALKEWSSSLFSDAKMQLLMAQDVIFHLDKAQESRALSSEELALYRQLKTRILGLAAVERSRRWQCSRLIWLREGDACTKFFHLKANARRRKKAIPCLKTTTGEYVWSHAEKEQVVYDFFRDIIGQKEQRLCTLDWDELALEGLQQQGLDLPFTTEEIWYAINQMPKEKAPGPDGFTTAFYTACWPIIQNDILAAFQCIYSLNTGPLHRLNGATVTLLPKTKTAEHPKDFRPISLIHSFAKLVSKVLALRLASSIDALVSKSQSAFIKRRCIQDNFLYVRNLARTYHRTSTPALLLKLDISKAFDSISWEYMLELMEKRGFPPRWRDWLSLIFRSSSSCFLLNRVIGQEIKHERGLRQGDPLSPYLFILAIDTLQRIFELATDSGHLSPLRYRHAKLRVSLYADDAVIFVNPNRNDLEVVNDILDKFGQATGLKINVSKCQVAPIHCQDIDLDHILQPFEGQRVSFPLTYLGLPLSLGRLRLVHLQSVKDRIVTRLAGWQGNLLNLGGRRELVRSVLSAIPTYVLTALRTPKAFTKEIDKARRRFLWAGNQQLHGGKCKVNWARVQRPISRGGLGISNLDLFSRALRLRWLWFEWHYPDKPWAGTELPLDDVDRALFAACTHVTVPSGQKASFWMSSWLNGTYPAALLPNLYKHSKRKS